MRKKTLIATLLLLLSTGNSWAADNCKPSRWGADDEIGNVNLITPESVLAASKLVNQRRCRNNCAASARSEKFKFTSWALSSHSPHLE